MILEFIASSTLVSLLFTLGGLATERMLAYRIWPRRVLWTTLMVLSMAVPVATKLPSMADTQESETKQSSVPRMDWPGTPQLDPLLVYAWFAWFASSVGLLLFYSSCWLRLRRQSEDWSLQLLDGVPVRVTDELGPAVFGNTRPLIIVPQWLCVSPPSMRAYVLRHALEHIAARDPLLLMGAFVATALLPWNILLWWQLRRLRLAIDIDCNARVLRTSVDVNAYNEMLREVSRRGRRMPLGVVALG